MGWIKKITVFLIGLIAILAISFFVFKYYRTSKAENFKIPENTASVIRLNVDDLLVKMFKNSLSNYSEYYGSKKDSSSVEDKPKLWNIGVHIPAKLYMFSLSDTSYQYYSVLEVSDKAKLQAFLERELGLSQDSVVQSLEKGQDLYAKKHVQVLLDDHKLVFSLGKDYQPETMLSLLKADQGDWVYANGLGKNVSEIQEADMSFVDKKDNWAIVNFQNGRFDIDAFVKSSLLGFPSKPVQATIPEDNVFYMALNSDLSLILKDKEAELEKLKLPVDSIYKYVGNFAAIELKDKEVLESDTIITYDYDDNFEMTEKKEINQVEVPSLTFQVMASPHLLGYLPEKMFYKFGKDFHNGLIRLSTDPAALGQNMELQPSSNVFVMSYQKKPVAAKYLGWLPNYDKILKGEVNGIAEGTNGLRLKGGFDLENPAINSFYQIIGSR